MAPLRQPTASCQPVGHRGWHGHLALIRPYSAADGSPRSSWRRTSIAEQARRGDPAFESRGFCSTPTRRGVISTPPPPPPPPRPRISIRGSAPGLQAARRVFLPTVWVHVALHRFALLRRVLHRIVHTMRVPEGGRTAMPRRTTGVCQTNPIQPRFVLRRDQLSDVCNKSLHGFRLA